MAALYFCHVGTYHSCATSINLAFEGVDANSAAFQTGAQIRKLNSFSVLSLYFKAKEKFMDVVSHMPSCCVWVTRAMCVGLATGVLHMACCHHVHDAVQ